MVDHQAPKRRRAWIGALVVLLVLAVAGGVAAAMILTDDGGGDSSEGPEREKVDGVHGRALEGTGYAYALPEGWNDITSDAVANELPEGVDSVSGRGTSFSTSGATIIIERFAVKEGTSTADVQKSWEANLTEEKGLKATYVPSLRIDGEPALGRQIRRALVGGDAILQVAYLVIHQGYGYSIGLNSAEGDSNAGAAFDGVVSSWVWVD
jgi:hypothetical protein